MGENVHVDKEFCAIYTEVGWNFDKISYVKAKVTV